jgi:hypothetical protein
MNACMHACNSEESLFVLYLSFQRQQYCIFNTSGKMVDILPQMKEAFINGPIARKVSLHTHSVHKHITSTP